MHATRKGQGATEYLVLLAVVLIVAMVAIALLGFFPGISGNVQADQSKAYWTGVAKPFSITESTQSSATLYLRLKNNEPDIRYIEGVVISRNGAYISGQQSRFNGNTIHSGAPVTLSAGQIETIEVQGLTPSCTPGTKYSYGVNITYRSNDLGSRVQVGAKELVGTCTP